MKKRSPCLLPLMMLCCLSSCKKEFNIDNWSPDILAPIIKSKATAKEVCDLKNKKFTQSISAFDLEMPVAMPINVPAFEVPFVGPYQVELSDFFSYVEVDSAALELTLMNSFPIAIAQGTDIVFRRTAETADESNLIFRHTISRDITPGETYIFTTILRAERITSDVFLYLENFKSPGGEDVTFSQQPTELSFEFKFLRVFQVAVRTNREHIVQDTSEISFLEDLGEYDENTAIGTLRVFLTNAMPINFGFQIYFMDETKTQVIDSIYTSDGIADHLDMYSPGGTTTAITGAPLDSTEVKFEVLLSAARIRKLKSAKFIVFRLKGDTKGYPGEAVYVGAESNMQVLITGDLKIKIASIF